VVHELRWLPPALVFEQHDGEAVFIFKLEADIRAEPLGGPLDHLPYHARVGIQLDDPHLEDAELTAVVGEAELDHAARLAVAGGFGGPPACDAFGRCQGLVDLIARGLDSYSMQNVEHGASPQKLC
jgi:hypothetical protein